MDERIGGFRLQHGGAGWTRTSDNAIMSRALYHLSYGTAQAGPELGALKSYLAVCARAFSLRFFTRRLASATRFLLFKPSPEFAADAGHGPAGGWESGCGGRSEEK